MADPLEWQRKKVFQKETGLQIEVTSAIGHSGREMLSFNIGSVSQKTGKTSKHVKEVDLLALQELLIEVIQWQKDYRVEQGSDQRGPR